MKNQLIRIIAAVALLCASSNQASADMAMHCQDLAIRTFQAAHGSHTLVITRVNCESVSPAPGPNGNQTESLNQECLVRTSIGYNAVVTLNPSCNDVISFENAL